MGQSKKSSKPQNKEHEILPVRVSTFDSAISAGGVERGSSLLVSGGCGTGKTTFTLQSLYNGALKGEKGLYISLEENAEKLKAHMHKNFGWDVDGLEKKGLLSIRKIDPFEIAKAVEAELMRKRQGKLLIRISGLPSLIPKNLKPDRIVLDSLSALSAAFAENREMYRIFLRQIMESFEKYDSVNFFLSETEQNPELYSRQGIEEFLVDGVIVLYNVKAGHMRQRAIEILKLRCSDHSKKIMPYQITKNGIEIYPDQEIF